MARLGAAVRHLHAVNFEVYESDVAQLSQALDHLPLLECAAKDMGLTLAAALLKLTRDRFPKAALLRVEAGLGEVRALALAEAERTAVADLAAVLRRSDEEARERHGDVTWRTLAASDLEALLERQRALSYITPQEVLWLENVVQALFELKEHEPLDEDDEAALKALLGRASVAEQVEDDEGHKGPTVALYPTERRTLGAVVRALLTLDAADPLPENYLPSWRLGAAEALQTLLDRHRPAPSRRRRLSELAA